MFVLFSVTDIVTNSTLEDRENRKIIINYDINFNFKTNMPSFYEYQDTVLYKQWIVFKQTALFIHDIFHQIVIFQNSVYIIYVSVNDNSEQYVAVYWNHQSIIV